MPGTAAEADRVISSEYREASDADPEFDPWAVALHSGSG